MAQIISSLSNANLAWLYYKRYYQEVDFTKYKEEEKEKKNKADKSNKELMESVNETITARTVDNSTANAKAFGSVPVNPLYSKYLYTSYPGLLTGSGYSHETGKEGETKIGFFFDHATGMPCLPGHSIKGMLHSYFPQWHNNDVMYKKEKQEYILKCLKSLEGFNPKTSFQIFLDKANIKNIPDCNAELFVRLLETIIFDGKKPKVSKGEWLAKNGNYEYESLSIYERDIFHDAYICDGGKGYKILGMDAITPHPDPLKNPKPLIFIKVLPNVNWQFQFHLKDNLISSEDKLFLFEQLITTFGIGAKTNVGYGQLKTISHLDRQTTNKHPIQVKKLTLSANQNMQN